MNHRCFIIVIVAASFTITARAQEPTGQQFIVRPEGRETLPAEGSGTIRGRVTAAETGMPLSRALIELSAPSPSGGGARQSQLVFTDDRGRFEFVKIGAGSYTLAATKAGYAGSTYRQTRPRQVARPLDLADRQVIDDVEFVLPRQGVIIARVSDEFGEAVGGAPVQLQQYGYVSGTRQLSAVSRTGATTTNDLGEIRMAGLLPGEYYVSVRPPQNPLSPFPSTTAEAAATYFPGTVALNEAKPIVVSSGREIYAPFAMLPMRAARFSGTLRKSDGSVPVTPRLMLGPSDGSQARSVAVHAGGAFEATLTPGEYTLYASSDVASARAEFATIPLTVSGDDRSLSIVTAPGGSLRGRVVFDGGTPPTLQPSSLPLTLLSLASGPPMGPSAPQWRPGWTFEFNGVGGSRVLGVRAAVDGWFLKAITYDGRDITDMAVDFSTARNLADVEVVLTQKPARVEGVVNVPPVAIDNATVILFPVDRARWTPQAGGIATARPDQQGRFAIAGLRPGAYHIVALDYLDNGEERDAQLLQRLADIATPVTLADGESRTLNLTVVTR